ncbi:Transcriptional regulatory protein tctD [Xenorhabdus bovienii str. kraussei Becker Underwood]|uniref:Transcriptional regulatory protein tctD n=2 Tax=Xenorhabdus bovienii TaxID=40576 RepID=A0A077PHM2_XENBV|nr:Transcriptional regulatory protein tctD [Xenorhabdus bovienii str. kraussei Becker Underwood]
MTLLLTENYTLLILDVALPRLDGISLLSRLRKRGQNLPVLLLTAKADVADRVKGLNSGADDYLTKPFDFEELEARIRALLRRSVGSPLGVQQFGSLAYEDAGYFLLDNQPLALTPREFSVLTTLFHRRGRPVSKQQLFEQVFSLSEEANPQSIELYVHRLRKKLFNSDIGICTLRGLGYRLELQK